MNKRLSQVLVVSILAGLFFLMLKPVSIEAMEVEKEKESTIEITGTIGKKSTIIDNKEPENKQQLVLKSSDFQQKQLPKLASIGNKMAWFGWLLVICWLLCLRFSLKQET
ncbi:hypothetical protein P7E02_10775 [Enterococcus hulanensis]|uniref:hypothetical protein n=1 Tax=Enterococcus hulanensis TaxID=2559929 RepID=UPI0028903DC2|nr:hypothetical protein [Enterococcus hulanensis]MDT2660356.1 hypothetical protein [Enterococcus hulanensis]